MALAWDVCQKTMRLLQKLGRSFDAEAADADRLAQDYPLLAACCAASLQGTVALGERAGRRLERRGVALEHGGPEGAETARTPGHGFNLHAAGRVAAHDKKGRERALRYILRPPLATGRLTRRQDGRVTHWLKQPWTDGSQSVTFEPLDFIAKLVPLVPPPRANFIHYHGAWAPHAAIRRFVVPPSVTPGGQLPLPLAPGDSRRLATAAPVGGPSRDSRFRAPRCGPARPQRISWSELAKRTFDIDLTQCARCGHTPIRVVAVVTAPTREQLVALGDGSQLLPARPERSRAPPWGQMSFAFPRAAA